MIQLLLLGFILTHAKNSPQCLICGGKIGGLLELKVNASQCLGLVEKCPAK